MDDKPPLKGAWSGSCEFWGPIIFGMGEARHFKFGWKWYKMETKPAAPNIYFEFLTD